VDSSVRRKPSWRQDIVPPPREIPSRRLCPSFAAEVDGQNLIGLDLTFAFTALVGLRAATVFALAFRVEVLIRRNVTVIAGLVFELPIRFAPRRLRRLGPAKGPGSSREQYDEQCGGHDRGAAIVFLKCSKARQTAG